MLNEGLLFNLVLSPSQQWSSEKTAHILFWNVDSSNFFLDAVLFFIFLSVLLRATLWYKYHEREEKPYSHAYVEEYYGCYIRRMGNTSNINK